MNHFLVILLSIVLWGDFNDIAKVNDLKRQAKEEYNAGKYKEAIGHYKFLTDSLQIKDDNITLNLANAYYQLKDTANAKNNYNNLIYSGNKSVKSVAHQQLGIMANRNKKFKEAINHFKEALKADPSNEDARYNYELLKKILKEQEQKDQQQNQDKNQDKDKKDDKNQDKKDQENKENQDQKDQDKKDGQEKDQKDQDKGDKEKQKKEEEKKQGEEKDKKEEQPKEGEQKEDQKKSDEQPSLAENLKDMKISEEKAKMIMEALKNNEIQYIQQNKRKATKKKDPDKPDW
ncbi:MAG TPA: hypothetical protein PKL31_05105 [Fulvivirga sp.]|nr:hypothetical protein [Fulvivirga sp.]